MGDTNSLLSVPKAALKNYQVSTLMKSEISLKYKNRPDEVFAFWQNQSIKTEVVKGKDKTSINIPKKLNILPPLFYEYRHTIEKVFTTT